MKTTAILSALVATASLAFASPAPTATNAYSAVSVSVPAPTATSTASSLIDSSATPAQASIIKALLAQSPEGPNAPNGTFIEIFVTSDSKMYIRYQHSHPGYREFNTTDGKPVPPTGYGDDDDLGQAMLMEAIYGGKDGSLGDSMAKAWSLYKSYYGSLPTGVPSQILSETAATYTGVATKV